MPVSKIDSSGLASSVTLTTPTLSSPTFSGTMSGSVITSGTTQATTSGSNIDFVGIPAWVKRITVMFSGVSSNGTAFPWLIQLGTSSGVEATGYLGAGSGFAAGVSTSNSTVGFSLNVNNSAANVVHGSVIITLLNATTNSWTAFGVLAQSDAARTAVVAGSKSLGATLTRVRITTNAVDTYDAGSINILYE